MNKQTFHTDVTNDTEFWIVLAHKDIITTIDNVGGNRFVLVFTTEEKAEHFWEKVDQEFVDIYWSSPVRKLTWGEIVRMSGADRRCVYFHFDLPPNAKRIDSKNIICIEPGR